MFLSIGIALVLLLLLVFGNHGLINYQKLMAKEEQVAEQSEQIRRENRVLGAEVDKLKTDAEYIKHVAKHEYEMVEEDDMIFKDEHPQ